MDVPEPLLTSRVATFTSSPTPITILIPSWANGVRIFASVLSLACIDASHEAPSKSITSQLQRIVIIGSPTGGFFKLRGPFSGVESDEIAHDASTADVKTALVTLDEFSNADITEYGGPLPAPVDLMFEGAYAGNDLPLLEVSTNALTGGTEPNVGVTVATEAVNAYAYIEGGATESWPVSHSSGERYLHIATDSGNGSVRVTFLRG